MNLRNRVNHVLNSAPRQAPYFFFPSRDGGDGWIMEESSGGAESVIIRWHWKDPTRRDHELRAELLKPIAAFLGTHRFAVAQRVDERGPFLRVTDR